MKKVLLGITLAALGFAAQASTYCGNYESNLQWEKDYAAKSEHTDIEIWVHEHSEKDNERTRLLCLQSKKPGARIGMTAKQVIDKTSWGEPDSVNRTTTAHGTTEQWVYEGDDSNSYLYFTNGKLTAIQN